MFFGLSQLTDALSPVLKRAGIGRKDPLSSLASLEQTHAILERERERTNRTGAPFSAITFAPRSAGARRATAVALVPILRARLRSLDEIGWVDDGALCAVLPGTPAPGAWQIVNDVCERLPADVPSPYCTVYTYPSGGGDFPPAPAPTPGGGGGAESPAAKGVAPLEAVFVRQMPRWKRALDVLGAAAGLALLSPVLAAAAAAVKLSSPGPAFFAQRRSGLGGRPFLMYKFRSMVLDAEARKAALMAKNEQDGPAFKLKDDPRVTRVGRFLRATSIDELPQLWNVLRGDMSLVGPRPLPVAEADACDLWQRRRLDVTPGLTCIWQVRGRGRASFADWVRMDLEYIRSQSLPQDLRLLLLTGPAVVLRKGAH